MPTFMPLKNDPDQHDIKYDYKELKKLHQNAKDIFMFSQIMEEHAHNMHRLRGFCDEEMACMARIYSKLTEPFASFFFTVMQAAGDIAIDRKKDPKKEPKEPSGKTIQLVRVGNAQRA